MKEILILGTMHLESENDVKNTKGKEHLKELQSEIDELVEKLSDYKPNKVFVEFEKTEQADLDAWYKSYLNGKANSSDEICKVAFALAKKCNAKVIGCDWMEQGAATVACSQAMDELEKYPELKAEIEKYEGKQADLSKGLLNSYRMLNSEQAVSDSKAYYINYARIGVDNYYGMGWLIWWYQRNMNIFANISDSLEDGDKALLLIGAAHKGILEELFTDSKSVKIVDLNKYI